MSKQKLDFEELKKSIYDFFEKQNKFKQVQEKYNRAKAKFNSDMEEYFQEEGITKISIDEFVGGSLVVNRVQKVGIEFYPDKLEKAIGDLSKDVIIKQYQIIDMPGLIEYLKECGVDSKVFKSFINVSKTVDTKELDRLEELGKITEEQIKGCYTIKRQNPYFTVGVKKGQDNE